MLLPDDPLKQTTRPVLTDGAGIPAVVERLVKRMPEIVTLGRSADIAMRVGNGHDKVMRPYISGIFGNVVR